MNPEDFVEKLLQFTAHTILTLTTYRQSSMLNLNDPYTTSHDITLRDLVFVLQSGFRIVQRSQEEVGGLKLSEIGENIMLTLSNKIMTENPFRRNHSKLVVQLIFCVGLMDEKEKKLEACLQSVFSVFRAQVAASYLFQKESGLASY